jgi:chromosome segregation protein
VHLKSLTLKGFKSFAEPTTFAFEPGVTCVVGPNGSGKSNVVDALAWVMGEQGAKTLRGGSMEDVIFAGTQSRGPLGRAEVALTIDNSDGALPIDYTEVTISRTLFRNGGSEYAINREPCRLLDVQELLSDTGLGREMHVIVGQGQLDSVLHASAEDRRRFIEEAAGILKHRRRKEKTERKLEAMEANLMRLNDLTTEIRRQLTPLGRQAQVAKQAQTIQAVVRDARARLLADDVTGLRRTLDGFAKDEGDRNTERMVVNGELSGVSAEREKLEASLGDDSVDSARRLDYELRRVAERIASLHALATERVALLSRDDEAPELDISVSDSDIAQLEELVAAREKVLAEREVQLGTLAADTATAQAARAAAEASIQEASAVRNRWLATKQELATAVEVAHSRWEAATSERERIDSQLAAATARLNEVDKQWVGIDDGHDAESQQAYEAAEAALTSAWEAEADAARMVDEARNTAHQLERERDSLAAKVSTLTLAIEADSFAPDVVGTSGVRGRVADSLTITPGYEAAIARALGTLADALLVESRQDAYRVASRVTGRTDGRVDMIVASDDAKQQTLSAPAGLIPASEVVTGPAGVMRVLRTTFIADTLDAVDTHWISQSKVLPDGALIVTVAGDVFSDTVVQSGAGQKRSIVELTAERDQATTTLREVTTTLERLQRETEAAIEAHQKAQESAKATLHKLREVEAQRAQLSEKVSGLTAMRDAARSEMERLTERLELAKASIDDAWQTLEKHREALAQADSDKEPDVDDSARVKADEALDAAREIEMNARLGLESARAELRQATEELTSTRSRRESELASKEAHRAKQAERIVLHERALRVVALTPLLGSVANASVDQSGALVADGEANRKLASEQLTQLRLRESQLRQRLQELTDSVHSVEMNIYERKLQLGQIIERATDELGLTEEVLLADYGPDQMIPADPEDDLDTEVGEPVAFNRAEQEARLQKAERKLAQLGRVNPLALEEFSALEKRHQFLVEQLDDVTASRKDLISIIGDLDETMQVIFAQAFEDTREAFDRVFPVLFPGGEGKLALTDPDDLLRTGIEVSVKPRGKKIERLSLLSGGERSLAAVALLIAIFIARPSPFYILDEVEAALDDANLGRLLTIMEDLRKDSQLIIITHQKRTMEIADALYGVSMRDDGVSAVVGQRVRETVEKAS